MAAVKGPSGPADKAPQRPVAVSVRSMAWKLFGALGFGVLGLFAVSLISNGWNAVKVIQSLKPVYVVAALLLILLEIVCQALRLQAIVQSIGFRIPMRTALRNILVGEFFARITPFEAGGGEPAQIYMLFKDDSINVGDSTMVFAIKALLAGASQMVVVAFVPIWLVFTGRSLEVGHRFQVVLYVGIGTYMVTFAALVYGLVKLPRISASLDVFLAKPVELLNGRGRFLQRTVRRVEKFIKDSLRARQTAIHANRLLLAKALLFSFVSWGLVLLTPIILLYGLGVNSSITQIVVATLIYYVAVSYFPTPGASVGAELGAAALFAAFVPNGILGAFVLIWRFFDHYVKMGAGGITAAGEFVLRPARRLKQHLHEHVDQTPPGAGRHGAHEDSTEDKEGAITP